MNKNRKIKRGLTTSLAVGMSVMMGAVPVFAAGTSSDADAVYKEETVYVNADATGTIDEVTVSNWLKNSGSVSGSLTDASTLKDIKNVKGDETYSENNGKLVWQGDKKDICYQGTTTKKIPVGMKVTYELDGKKVSADDLEGKKIGVQLGTTGDTIATDIKDATVERYNKGNDAVMALKQGKIDCVVIDSEPAKKFVEKNDDLQLIDNVFDKEEYAICISKDNTDLTKEFNDALKELEDEGTLDSIRDNYIGDDAGKTPYETPKDADHSKGTLTMATNATFQPYEYYDGDNIVGIDVDIAKAICDKLGYDLKVEDMEFDAIVNAVKSGKADFGAAGMTVTEDRKKSIDFTDPYTTAEQVIIVQK